MKEEKDVWFHDHTFLCEPEILSAYKYRHQIVGKLKTKHKLEL